LWGKGHAPQLSAYLEAIRFRGQVDLGRALAGLSKRGLSRGGLVVLISDLLAAGDLAAGLRSALDRLAAPAWQVVVCHLLHPQEIDPALSGHFQMQDVETGQRKHYNITSRALEGYRQHFAAWQSGMAELCREKKAVYSLLRSDWSLEKEMIPQLRRDRVVIPL
jgi:hypothetical protein